MTPKLSFLSSSSRGLNYNLVPFSNYLVDCIMNVGKGFKKIGQKIIKLFDAFDLTSISKAFVMIIFRKNLAE